VDKLLETYIKKENNLFQSDLWEDFQQKLGRQTYRVNCNDCEVLIIVLPLFRNLTYLYCPRAPQTSTEGWYLFLNKARQIAKNEKAVFIRVEPFKVPNGILKKLRFKKVKEFSPLSQQFSPMNTLLLDISGSDEDILAQMKPKWRYNIKLAERKGVTVRESDRPEDLEKFHEIGQEMITRGYHSFELRHYQKLFEALTTKNIKMFIAEHEKDILSIIIVAFYHDLAIYLHGVSSENKRELMPNHLNQWYAIREAKKRNCMVYDFWGTAPKNKPNHPWAGITRFKIGFGGEEVQFIGAFDYTFKPIWYIMFSLFNLVRKKIRG
jgi:lipid II:glycine glycyltransferase (peptidoglycan interpeptide bridge formation enzyme)